MIGEKTVKLLELHEGKVPWVYRDVKGIWTIGIGRNVDKDHGGPGLRDEEMRQMLQNDLIELERKLRAALPDIWPTLSEVRRAVLLSVAFNCGFNGLLRFRKTLQAVSEKRWHDASRELLDSNAARLLRDRYRVLAAMLATDRWPSTI